jgi:hypothetical protein
MISIGVADISPVPKTRSDGYFRTAVIERFLGARRSRLFGRDAPQVVATVCRALSVVSIEGDWPGHSRKASFYVGAFAGRKAAANFAHPRTIDPSEGVDPFGRGTQT